IWPNADPTLLDDRAELASQVLVVVAGAVRRYKSDRAMSLGAELQRLHVQVQDPQLLETLWGAEDDLSGVTRAERVDITNAAEQGLETIPYSSSRPLPIAVSLVP
ncbi:MAG TPA: hypothetical protein VF221_06925, partial [Chloroflexota bacterium]